MRMRKKKWVEPFLKEENQYKTERFDGNEKPVYLEIGMGMGDFITQSAKLNPDIFYVGLEKDETCVARAIRKAQELELDNFRVLLANADKLNDVIKEKTVDRIYLHFSDPWPKKAHHKRRLTYKTYLNLYEKILKQDGEIIFKTDNTDFFYDSIEYFRDSIFAIEEINDDYDSRLFNEPMTAYQIKFMEQGVLIHYARLRLRVK